MDLIESGETFKHLKILSDSILNGSNPELEKDEMATFFCHCETWIREALKPQQVPQMEILIQVKELLESIIRIMRKVISCKCLDQVALILKSNFTFLEWSLRMGIEGREEEMKAIFISSRDILEAFSNFCLSFPFREKSHFSTILSHFLHFHPLLNGVDNKALGLSWKAFIKCVKLFPQLADWTLIENSLDILIPQTVKTLFKCEESKSKELQIAVFFYRIIKQLTTLFPDALTRENIRHLISLLIPSLAHPFYREHFTHREDVRSNATLILNDVISNPIFAELLITEFHRLSDSTYLLGFVMADFNKITDDNQRSYYTSNDFNIFDAFMKSLHNFTPVLLSDRNFLPGIQLDGKPMSTVSVHEYLLIRVQAFIAGLNEKEFEMIEDRLFRYLLEFQINRDWISGLFLLDIWVFIGRYGQANLCYQHIEACFEIKKSLSINCELINSLIARLSKLLNPKRILKLLTDHDNDENLKINSEYSNKEQIEPFKSNYTGKLYENLSSFSARGEILCDIDKMVKFLINNYDFLISDDGSDKLKQFLGDIFEKLCEYNLVVEKKDGDLFQILFQLSTFCEFNLIEDLNMLLRNCGYESYFCELCSFYVFHNYKFLDLNCERTCQLITNLYLHSECSVIKNRLLMLAMNTDLKVESIKINVRKINCHLKDNKYYLFDKLLKNDFQKNEDECSSCLKDFHDILKITNEKLKFKFQKENIKSETKIKLTNIIQSLESYQSDLKQMLTEEENEEKL